MFKQKSVGLLLRTLCQRSKDTYPLRYVIAVSLTRCEKRTRSRDSKESQGSVANQRARGQSKDVLANIGITVGETVVKSTSNSYTTLPKGTGGYTSSGSTSLTTRSSMPFNCSKAMNTFNKACSANSSQISLSPSAPSGKKPHITSTSPLIGLLASHLAARTPSLRIA